MEEKDQREGRTWGIFCHLGALSMYLGVPLGNILVPLIIWLIKKDDLPLVDEHGKQSLNFQISLMLYAVIAAIVYVVVLMILYLVTAAYFPGCPGLHPAAVRRLLIVHLVFTITAAIKAGNGEVYRYPGHTLISTGQGTVPCPMFSYFFARNGTRNRPLSQKNRLRCPFLG